MHILAHISSASTPAQSLWAGFTHPILGIDHLIAMLGVGIIAGRFGGRLHWQIPAAFVAALAAGGAAGILGVRFVLTELGVAASVAVIGITLVTNIAAKPIVFAPIAGFAYLHGLAHGGEVPTTSTPALYVVGFVTASAALHAAAIPIGIATRRTTTFHPAAIGNAFLAIGGLLMIRAGLAA